jgi:hypothetical protein
VRGRQRRDSEVELLVGVWSVLWMEGRSEPLTVQSVHVGCTKRVRTERYDEAHWPTGGVKDPTRKKHRTQQFKRSRNRRGKSKGARLEAGTFTYILMVDKI